ncbi:MAG: GTP-binding protein [Chloroflexi bacterium]|nr:GTP-binding protein [Chloroflexota bacterium]
MDDSAVKTPEEVAIGRIEEAMKDGRTTLDLSGLGIKALPDEIKSLSNLISLNISKNHLTVFNESFWFLTSLQELNLRENDIAIIPDEISMLSNLEKLDLYGNQLNSVSEHINLIFNLRELNLSYNIFSFFPENLQNKYLESLLFEGHQIAVIPSTIGELTNLKKLGLSRNQIQYLPPEMKELRLLDTLDISFNKLDYIPEEVKFLSKLKFLDLRNNFIPVPFEILENVTDPNFILQNYFGYKGQKRYPIHEAKILFVGQGSVGKTSLIKRITSSTFDSREDKTDGINISQWSIPRTDFEFVRTKDISGNASIRLNIWDFGGQEIMHATHQFFLSRRSVYVLVLDTRLSQEENRLDYWLKIIQAFGGNSPVIIVGNKIDQHPLDIDRNSIFKKYPIVEDIVGTSAALSIGIDDFKSAIIKRVNLLAYVRDLLPESWFTVKTKLEELGKQSNFITHDKYLDLCAENEVSDETSQRTLIGFLHDLGVVLHFQDDPRLEALGILNPQWVTNGVYKILNSHALFQHKGVLTVSMLDEILNLPEYPRGKRLFIVDMMKKFELCYDIESDKTFLVPDLLPKDQPDLSFNGIPAFEYVYPVLPSSVVTRFIVRMNQHICDGFVWRTGVVLKIGDNKALVKADIEDRKITIAIDGVEHTRRDALSAIRYQLDEIHNSIKGLNPEKRVPIPEAPNAGPLEYDYLLQLERDGFYELPVKDGNRLVKVDVRKLLSGVVSEAERRQSAGNTTNIYIGGSVSGTIIAGDDNEVQR